MSKKMSLLLLVGLFLLSLVVTSTTLAARAKAGKIAPETACWWVYRGTYPAGERWCYHCCNHPDCLPATCCDLYCEWR
ncbi:MAG: hypothetical protein J7M16_02680 [Anaerolineae bacterium]|nr:hypothetical protein [Anaerolineae bacterium]